MTQETAVSSVKRAPTRRPLSIGRLRIFSLSRKAGNGRRLAIALACSAAATLFATTGRAGHEAPFYPSFYPQEIRIETLDRASASAGWAKARVHAYVGDDLFAGGAVPPDASSVASLRSYLVLSFDSHSGRYTAGSGDAKARCDAAGHVLRLLSQTRSGYVFHPYPITPYHADYLDQFDLAERARLQYASPIKRADRERRLSIRAKGALAEALVPARWRADSREWDATLEEIDIGKLIDPVRPAPWRKEGWFQAHLLYTNQFVGGGGLWAEHAYRRLVAGEYRGDAERIDLERSLVTMLAAGCERVVVGYTLRREYFNSEYSVGVEDVAFDSQDGLLAPIFPRSVKIKDFPWNGWLRIGLPVKPDTAWNPVAGFSDAFGRLLWLTVGDPALLREPYAGSWMSNRASVAVAGADISPVAVPESALMPETDTGSLRPVGAGRMARQHLRYSVVTSAFHDGTATGVADILYPYVFAFRWGSASGISTGDRDPGVTRSTALTRDWLAGIEVTGVETQTRDFGDDLKFTYRVPIVDIYLSHRASDAWLAAAAAPPWSTLPWEVIVLMEEAVGRGVAAFSREEAQRRGIPWLDLVRDHEVGMRLTALVEEFRQQGYRPEALKPFVTIDEARERWAALAAFHAQYGHFLVTNGPYRLDSWSDDGAVLQVFRDPTYPLGVGTFDSYAIPLKAYISRIDDQGDRIEIRADVEQVVTAQRSYEIERVALAAPSENTENDERPECRYVIVGPAGNTVRAGHATPGKAGEFVIDLRQLGPPGKYTIATGLFIGGNRVDPEVKLIEHRVARVAAPRATSRPPRGKAAKSQ